MSVSVPVHYNVLYTCEGFGVDTREKARDIAESLVSDPIPGIQIVDPQPATRKHLLLAHSAEYTKGILTGSPARAAERNGLGPWSRDLSVSVLNTTGGVVAAVQTALTTGGNAGSLSSGLHHARYKHGAGFCTINGLVVGAKVALQMGVKRVLIVDFDAHCGGGTASLIDGVSGIEQVDVSVSEYDSYQSTSNAQLTMSNGSSYREDIHAALTGLTNPTGIDLILYNAGMDPHERCSTGGVAGITTSVLREREQLLFGWAQRFEIPVAFVLAGGYSGQRLSREELVSLHRMTLEAATL